MNLLIARARRRKRGRHTTKRFSWWHRMREYLWPSMGLRSFLRLQEIRIKRQKEAQHKVAMGLSIGVFVGFIPTFGQPFCAMFLSMLFKGSLTMAFVGSFVGNIWTFPLIFAWEYAVGHWLMGTLTPQPFPSVRQFFHILVDWQTLSDNFWHLYVPTLLGAVVLGVIFAVLTYFLTRVNIQSYQMARQAFLQRRQALHKEHRQIWKKLPPRHVHQ